MTDWFRKVEPQNGDSSSSPPLPKFEDAAELLNTPMKFPKEIIAGILHQGSKLALGGSSKSYKTYLLIDLAVAIATGQQWLGFNTVLSRVLYINLEIQRPFFTRRLRKICAKRGFKLRPGALDVWNLRDLEISILEIKEKLLGWVEPGDYALIIIDPIYKTFIGKDENATGEIKSVLSSIGQIARELDAAVAWAAHFSKGSQADKEAIDRISGSGVWGRDPDSIMTFTRHEQDDCFIVQTTLRDFPKVDDFTVRFEDGIVETIDGLDPTKFRRSGIGRPSAYSPEDLARILADDELETKAFCRRAMDEIGMSRRTFFNLKKTAEEKKLISQSTISKKWERCLKI